MTAGVSTLLGEPSNAHDDDEMQVLHWDHVITCRWRTAPTRDGLRVLREHQLARFDAVGKQRILTLSVIGPRATVLLDADARHEAQRQAKMGHDLLMGLAFVVEGTGFQAATTRGVIAGVLLAVRSPYPTKVFASVDDARPWIRDRLVSDGHRESARSLVAAFDAGLAGADL